MLKKNDTKSYDFSELKDLENKYASGLLNSFHDLIEQEHHQLMTVEFDRIDSGQDCSNSIAVVEETIKYYMLESMLEHYQSSLKYFKPNEI